MFLYKKSYIVFSNFIVYNYIVRGYECDIVNVLHKYNSLEGRSSYVEMDL